MYIDEKINNSKSNKILVVGQPMSGMTFSACKYAVEQAYLGKTVIIFRDTEEQLRYQGGLNDTLKRVQDAYKELNGNYSGEVLTRSIQSTERLGCFGDIFIHDNCRTRYSGPRTFSRWECREQEIVMSYYKYVKDEYVSMVAGGYEVIEATMEENVEGCNRNTCYTNLINALPKEEYKNLMELPSTREAQGYVIFHGGNEYYFKPDGTAVVNGNAAIAREGHVIINGGAK